MVTDTPSRQVLDAVPGRTVTFLIGVNTSPVARGALLAVGYTQDEHNHAWGLLTKLGSQTPSVPIVDKAAQDAVNELNAWDEPNFPVIHAILLRNHPTQAAFVFEGLAPSDIGAEAVVAIATLLVRLDMLESGKGRDKSTHKADKAAIARLEARGYTKKERERLEGLVKTTRSIAKDTNVEPVSSADAEAVKLELWGFLNEWSTEAKRVIKRRDVLIRLGIGKRQKRAKKSGEADGIAPPTQSTNPSAPAQAPGANADPIAATSRKTSTV